MSEFGARKILFSDGLSTFVNEQEVDYFVSYPYSSNGAAVQKSVVLEGIVFKLDEASVPYGLARRKWLEDKEQELNELVGLVGGLTLDFGTPQQKSLGNYRLASVVVTQRTANLAIEVRMTFVLPSDGSLTAHDRTLQFGANADADRNIIKSKGFTVVQTTENRNVISLPFRASGVLIDNAPPVEIIEVRDIKERLNKFYKVIIGGTYNSAVDDDLGKWVIDNSGNRIGRLIHHIFDATWIIHTETDIPDGEPISIQNGTGSGDVVSSDLIADVPIHPLAKLAAEYLIRDWQTVEKGRFRELIIHSSIIEYGPSQQSQIFKSYGDCHLRDMVVRDLNDNQIQYSLFFEKGIVNG